MNALDAYRDVLRELDKYESPSFTIKDFNYFYNKAISQYIDSNYLRVDLILKDSEDLASFVSLNSELDVPDENGIVELPGDFRHLLNLKINVEFTSDVARYRAGQFYEFWPERIKSGQKGFRNRSAYGKPNFRRYYYELYSEINESNEQKFYIKLLYDPTYIDIETVVVSLDYIKQPDAVTITSSSVFTDPLQFNAGATRNQVYYQILNVCRSIFLENVESQRTPITMQETATQQ
jgi:hypothetical protein